MLKSSHMAGRELMELKEHQVPVARQERENFKKEQGINCPQSTASVCNSVVSPCL